MHVSLVLVTSIVIITFIMHVFYYNYCFVEISHSNVFVLSYPEYSLISLISIVIVFIFESFFTYGN